MSKQLMYTTRGQLAQHVAKYAARKAGDALKLYIKNRFKEHVRRPHPIKGGSEAANAAGAPRYVTGPDKAFAQIYRKKRMTRRVKRRIRFTKNVQRAQARIRGLGSVSRVALIQIANANGAVAWADVGTIYGIHPTGVMGWDDLKALKNVILPPVSSVQSIEKFQLNRCVVEITLRNDAAERGLEPAGPAYCTLYEWVLRKDVQTAYGISTIAMMQSLLGATAAPIGTPETINDITFSPFEVSEFCKRFLIVKAHKIMLQPGESTTINRTYNRMVTWNVADLLDGSTIAGRKFRTRGWILRMEGEKRFVTGVPNYSTATSIISNFTRTYFFNRIPGSANEIGKT